MKKFIYFLLFFFASFVANSQTQPSGIPSPRSDSGFAQYNWVRALKGGFIFPERDTAFTPTYIGTVIFWRNAGVDSSLWVYAKTTGRRWSKVVTLSGGVSSGTVTSIATNNATGITGGTITSSGTLALDTTLVSTRLWRQKGIDSVQYNLTSGLLLKVNISDTALMLNPYLRKTDTSAMLSNYVPTFRTINTNAPLFGGGNLTTNRTLGADTGRNAAQLVTGGSLTAVKDSLVALIASSGGGTVLSVSTTDGYGVISSVADPTSTPNISLRVDTVSISTRDWRQKGIDSVQNNLTSGLALKLNLSDTAAMLSNRLKISDTATMLLPFMQYSDTSNMLSPYRRTTTKIQNSDLANSTISGISLGSNLADLTFGQYLQVGASSYNGSAATTITTNGTSTNAGSTLVARDVNGDFSARNISATLLGTASVASTVTVTNDITTNATYYPMFSTVTTGSTSTRVSSSKLTYNPSTGMLSSTGFTGALTGNASTATILQTARTINGVAFDGSADITISAAVGNSLTAGYGITGSPFDGALARTWLIDTSNISTKANVTGALVAKLNIYDTAAMLSGYKTYYPRTAISAGTGISYNAATGVITNSSPSSGGTVTSVATNNGSGITGGTITSTGTIAADTSILSTKANVVARLLGYVDLSTNQTIGGAKTFSNDIFVNGVRVGIGAGSNTSNTIFGVSAINSNTTGIRLAAFGERALASNTTGIDNTAFGWYSVDANNTGSGNTGVGSGALGNNTTGSNNVGIGIGAGEYIAGLSPNSTGNNSIFIGYNAKAAANGQTNQIVIGYDAEGNGSNTATFGNSSITNNYFTGNIRGGAFIKSGGTSSQFLKADGSIDANTYLTSADITGKLNISDTAAMLAPFIQYSDTTGLFSNVVRTFGTQTVGGNKTFSGITQITDATASTSTTTGALVVTGGLGLGSSGVNGVRIHRGLANEANSLGLGTSTLTSTTTGQSNVAVGISAMVLTTTGGSNTAVGESALAFVRTGNNNVGFGRGAGSTGSKPLTTGSNNIYIGRSSQSSDSTVSNETVIGASLTGNGSNTVTIGNSSVTDNYFTGNIRGGAFIKSGGTSSQFLKADGSVDASTYLTTSTAASTYLPLSGGTLTGALNITNANINLSNAYFLAGKLVGGTNISMLGMNASDKVSLDPNGYGVVVGNTLNLGGALSGTSAAFSGLLTLSNGYYINSGIENRYYNAANNNWGVIQGGSFTGANLGEIKIVGGSGNGLLVTNSGNTLIKTTFDNGTDDLQVAGSVRTTDAINLWGINTNPVSLGTSQSFIRTTNTGGDIYFGIEGSANGGFFTGSTAYATVFYGNSNPMQFILSGTKRLEVNTSGVSVTGAITASSSVTANSFVKSGGTSAQFLKADGSVDGSTYLTSAGAVTSIAGTTNQITVSASTGAVTVSLPSAVTISGAMNASSFFETSDLRKKDIVSVTEQSDGIDFVGFKWKKELNLDNRKHLGVIAQQVEQVIPDAVTTDEKGFKSVNYTEVMLYKLEKLTEKVSELEKELKKLKTNSKKLKN